MAKINASQVKSMASKGGLKVPPKPRPTVAVKSPDQLKKEAKARAQQRVKMLVRVLIFAAIAGAIALVVYLVKFHGRMPKDAFYQAVEYAYTDKLEPFKGMFTQDSIELVEASDGKPERHWQRLMDGISPEQRPKVVKTNKEEKKGIETALLDVQVDGHVRNVHMLREDGAWKINLNVALNPTKLTLPADIPPEYLQNFELSDENEAWWEDAEETPEGDGKRSKKGGGFFSKFFRR